MSYVEITKIKPVFTDNRGDIYDLVKEEIRHLGFVTFTPGALRGSHYHKKSIQYNYVFDGKVELFVKDSRDASSVVEKYILDAGNLVKIPRYIIHTFKGVTPAKMLEITSESRADGAYEDDNFKVDPLSQ